MSSLIFIKKEAQGEFGKRPEERTIAEKLKYAIINIDKPKGPTSHQVSEYVQKLLNLKKAGHSGTLDPQVTGVQPVALGAATRITQFLLTAPKEYICVMHIHKEIEEQLLRSTIKKFTGKINQLPPIKSAVKRQMRTREIYEIEIIEIKNKDILFRVKCQAGTYIRKLCHDLGQALGVGAHMAELRRSQAGPFTETDNLITLNDIQDALYYYLQEQNSKYLEYCLQPVENALKYIPKCWILDTAIISLSNGRDLGIPGISKLENFRKNDTVAIMSLKDELIAIGEAKMSAVEINTKDKGLAIKVEKVFITQQPKTQENKLENK